MTKRNHQADPRLNLISRYKSPFLLAAALLAWPVVGESRPPLVKPTKRLFAQNQGPNQDNRQRARELASRGSALFERGDNKQALDLFEEAYKLFPAPSLLYSLARAYEAEKDWLRARSAYSGFLANPPAGDKDNSRIRDAKEHMAKVESNLSRLIIKLPEPYTQVTIDGQEVTPEPDGSIWLAAGKHFLKWQFGDQELVSKAGESVVLVLPASRPEVPPVASPPAVASVRPASHSSAGRKAAAGVLGSLAVLSLGGAITLNVLDGRNAPGSCSYPGVVGYDQCVYNNVVPYSIAYAGAGALGIAMILTLTLPSRKVPSSAPSTAPVGVQR